ncbi:MAG: cytochrome c [Acidimicrobiia bacterium]|nr:cytochrome c [Acidimicrobiia bacterium]
MKRVVALVVVLAACGGGTTEVTGVAADGQELFDRRVLAENAGCVTCHSLKPDVVLVGPSLAVIGSDAANRVPGVTAEQYIRKSITSPDAYLLDGFDPGRMPQDWADQLTEAEIDALVQYLLTLGADG